MNNSRDYTKFFTPDAEADRLVSIADIKDGMVILEPHAGNGQLIRAMMRTGKTIKVECIEKDFDYVVQMKDLDISAIHICDFLSMHVTPKYDRIIANPPFGNGIDINAHYWKMFMSLKMKGILTTILPREFEVPNKGMWYCKYKGLWTEDFKTEAEARAAMLIYLLGNHLTTPEEVNKRLNK